MRGDVLLCIYKINPQVIVLIIFSLFQLAQEYLKKQTEVALLSRRMEELAERLSLIAENQSDTEDEEIRKLESEKVSNIFCFI